MSSHDICTSEEELKLKLKKLIACPANMEAASNSLYEYLLEDVLTGLAFDIHQLNRLGGVPVMSEEDIKQFAIVDSNDTDIFGQPFSKTTNCPICNRTLGASKFAAHLESCLGLGRTSSRIASRRTANHSKENAYGGTSDDDDDCWATEQNKTKVNKKFEGKKKKEKNGVRRVKSQKNINDKNH